MTDFSVFSKIDIVAQTGNVRVKNGSDVRPYFRSLDGQNRPLRPSLFLQCTLQIVTNSFSDLELVQNKIFLNIRLRQLFLLLSIFSFTKVTSGITIF